MLTDEQRADGWIEHDGGECPVEPYTFVTVQFRSGKNGTAPALHWVDRWSNRWEAKGPFRSEDIIAYKLENRHEV